jgi:hypothetical protein
MTETRSCGCDRGWIEAPRSADAKPAQQSVYPCRTCEPVSFLRWRRGHYAPGHDPGCSECSELRRSRKAREELREIADAAIVASETPTRSDYI